MDVDQMFQEPTDEQVAQFIKEFDEGKHPLTDEMKDALSTVGFRRSLVFSLEITELKRRIDEMEKDKARLDWCESNNCGVVLWYKDGPSGELTEQGFIADHPKYGIELARATAREAIDAAISAQAEEAPASLLTSAPDAKTGSESE